jgi:hypothetical protein
MKNRKARKRLEKRLLKARTGAKATVFIHYFTEQTDSKQLFLLYFVYVWD